MTAPPNAREDAIWYAVERWLSSQNLPQLPDKATAARGYFIDRTTILLRPCPVCEGGEA